LSSATLTVPQGSRANYQSANYWKDFGTITEEGSILVTGVSLPATLSGYVYTSATLTPTISPANATNQNVSWSTSNSAVATVSAAGVVSFVGAGNATITVTTQESGKTATCNVTVSIGGTTGPLTWLFVGSTLTISGTGAMPDYTSGNSPWDGYRVSITTVNIQNGVTSIGNYAFYACISLPSITIPNSVTTIGGGAFYDCGSLTSITIPNSVTTIGNDAFQYCRSLTSVSIGNSVTTIGVSAFHACWSLTSITIPSSVTTIGGSAFFGCTSLTSITIPNSVTTIGDGAFYGCSSLTSITIPNSVTTIGGSAFGNCTSLTSITIPSSVTTIGEDTFKGCSKLTSITIPNSVTTIGSSAFNNCRSLTSITIPNLVTSIGNQAFYNCMDLRNVTVLSQSPPSTGSNVFAFVPLSSATLTVPQGSKPAYEAANRWKYFGTIVEAP
jgi:hypothetical protein